MTSVRTRLLNLVLRVAVKRRLARGPLDLRLVHESRRRLEQLEEHSDHPRSATFSTTDLGGVAAERTMAPGPCLTSKTVLYLHGGAFALGSPRVYRVLTWRLAAATRAPVITPDYRLAPEHPYPAQHEDALAAYRALLDAGYDGRDLAVAGDSAGGNLVLALLQRLRSERLPGPACALCLSPWADLTGSGGSVTINAHRDPMLPASRLREAAELYAPGVDHRDPLLSPLFADYRGLPPLLVHVGSSEILLDDAVGVARAAEQAGVPTDLRIWPSQPHAFQVFGRLLPEARTAVTEMGRFVLYHWLEAADRAARGDLKRRRVA